MNSIVRHVTLASEFASSDYRQAMRALPGGVAIVTAGYGSEISGMTVTSLSSLSVEPPRVMVGVNRDASVFPLIRRFGTFGASILSADQQTIAGRFSTKAVTGAARFLGIGTQTLVSSAPLLDEAAAVIDCQVEEIIERHSHAIVIGRVLDARSREHAGGLAYREGKFIELRNQVESSDDIARWAMW